MLYFEPGDLVPIEIGGAAKVIKKLGEGGQGAVYLVEYGGKRYALKWYIKGRIPKEYKVQFRENLSQNISDGSPSPKFIWPLLLTESMDDSFGYLMEVFPPEYTAFPQILLAKANFKSMEALINAALNLINAFRDLHRAGKSYQDLNDGGFVIRLGDGDVLICDCDNATPYGISLGIAGKRGYMAPEVVRGEERPSMSTDKYSLGVVLFKLLLRSDPLEGKRVVETVCLSEASERLHYGESPLFIFDPNDPANRPVRGIHNNAIRTWPRLPEYIRNAFVTTFTQGLMNPAKRLPDNEWQKLFIRFKEDLITCPSCGGQQYLSRFEKKGDGLVCPDCQQVYPTVCTLVLKRYRVVLFPGVSLYRYHTDSQSNDLSSEDYLTKTGLVIQSKQDPNRWGIYNRSGGQWFVTPEGGKPTPLQAKQVVPIVKGTKITFQNGETGEIV